MTADTAAAPTDSAGPSEAGEPNQRTAASARSKARVLWELTRGQRGRYAAAFAALIVGSLLLYAQPIIIGATIDYVLGGKVASNAGVRWAIDFLGGPDFVKRNLWLAGLSVIVLTSLSGTFMYLKSRWSAIACETIARQLRDRLYGHLQHLPCSYHDTAQTGDLVQRCSSDVETVRLFYSNQILEVVRASTLLLTVLPIIFWLDWVMALVAVSVLPVIITFALVFFAKVQGSFKAMDEAEGAMTTALQENLTGIRVVRAFARQEFEKEKFAGKNNRYKELNWKLFKIMAVYWASSDFLCFAQMTLVMLVGAYRVSERLMDVGVLVTFLMYVGIYLWPVRQMGRILTEMGKAMVALTRIREVLEAPEESKPLSSPASAGSSTSTNDKGVRVTFEHVTFKRREAVVLNDVSFTIEPGKTLALLGPSGSGKSTIAALLLRFYDPDAGRITIDGLDIGTLARKHVRSQISVVMQEPFLYSKTVRDNIRLGRFDAPEDQILEAAQMAHIHESIQKFEQQYDTTVGERGVTLSGGQRQRVAIARALLKDAPILILDDALSAVDTRTESQILDALQRRRGRHTTILVAHRLSTLMHADEILVLEHGRIVQRGTHESLLNVDGMYRRLWQIQTALEEDLKGELEDRGSGYQPEELVSSK
jgi:ATP-binding cassette subfamily B protein